MISLQAIVLFVVSAMISAVYGEGEKLKTHYTHPDVDAERTQSLIIGLVVGCSLACVFLIILCITYNYYKHKPYRNVPRDVEEPLTSRK